jgi:hypothetical protein
MMVRLAWMLGLILLVTNVGCASLVTRSAAPLAEQPAYPPQESVVVEFHAEGGKAKSQEISLEPGMTVGDALDKCKGNRRYRRQFVDVRRTAPGGAVHKMPINFDNGQRRVAHAANYALHPGDHVIVSEDPSTIVDDLAERYLGLNKKKRK